MCMFRSCELKMRSLLNWETTSVLLWAPNLIWKDWVGWPCGQTLKPILTTKFSFSSNFSIYWKLSFLAKCLTVLSSLLEILKETLPNTSRNPQVRHNFLPLSVKFCLKKLFLYMQRTHTPLNSPLLYTWFVRPRHYVLPIVTSSSTPIYVHIRFLNI
jgi:hypothetical protein